MAFLKEINVFTSVQQNPYLLHICCHVPHGKILIFGTHNPNIYKVNFKFSLSSIFYIEEMLTIICNSSNGLYFVYLFAVDHSFHCNLDLETCPDLETCLELVLLPNYIDLSYKQ